MKKFLKFLGIVFLFIILFRGFLYRTFVNYIKVDVRSTVKLTDRNLIAEIEQQLEGEIFTVSEIICLSNKITSEKLKFTCSHVSSNPNQILVLKKANCIGYAALYNSIGNYIVQQQNLVDKYEFNHLVGNLEFLGFNVHHIFKNPFFRNHDFNEIKNKLTNKKMFVDPSLRDYLWIDEVSSK